MSDPHCSNGIRRLAGISIGIAAAASSSAAFAQAAQSLILTFGGNSEVPIGGWTTIGIALMLAAGALVALRRKGASRFAQLCVLAATGGVLAVVTALPGADANVLPMQLVTSPLTVSPISCPSTLTFQNATGKATTIFSVALSGPANCTLIAPPAVAPPVVAVPSVQCTAGLVLPAGNTCDVNLYPNMT